MTRLTRDQRLLAIGLTLGVMLIAFETTAVVTALPTIVDDLDGVSLYGVTLAAYTLANLVALVVGGRLADRRGPRPTFLIAITVFVTGLVVSATAPAMAFVVVGRVLQGLGGGGLQPIAYSMVKRAFPEDRQPMIYVYLSSGWVLPSLAGPFLAGIITDTVGWRWVFAAIIPFAIVVAVVATVPMRAIGPTGAHLDEGERRVLMAVVTASGVGVFIVGLQAPNVWVVLASVIVGSALALPALRRLLPEGVAHAAPGQPAVLTARFFATCAFMGVDGFVPYAAKEIHGAPPVVQGFVVVGAALSWTGGQAWSAKHTDVAPARPIRRGFLLLFVGALAVTPVLWSGWPLWATFIGWAIGGLGVGMLYNPTTVTAMSYASKGREGLVSSQVQLTDALGFSVMGGIGGGLVALADRGHLDLHVALGIAFGLAAACALGGAIVSSRIRPAVSVAEAATASR